MECFKNLLKKFDARMKKKKEGYKALEIIEIEMTDQNNICVAHDSIRQGQGNDDPQLRRCHEAIHCEVLHGIQQPQIALVVFRTCSHCHSCACDKLKKYMKERGCPRKKKKRWEYPKRQKKWRTSLFDHVEASVCDVVVFEVILLRGEISDKNWVVLRRYERDCVKAHRSCR